MVKEAVKGTALLPVAAAAAFCGVTLYALGRTLSYMFRDVDPERLKEEAEKPEDAKTEQPEKLVESEA